MGKNEVSARKQIANRIAEEVLSGKVTTVEKAKRHIVDALAEDLPYEHSHVGSIRRAVRKRILKAGVSEETPLLSPATRYILNPHSDVRVR